MYSVKLKNGSFKYDFHNKKIGTNLDEWLIELLTNLGVTLTLPSVGGTDTTCYSNCGIFAKNNLFLKSGTTIKTSKTLNTMFDLEEYVVRLLIFYDLIETADYTTYCCNHKKRLHIFKDIIYFEKGKFSDKKSSILKWFKEKADEWSITLTDPCC